MATSQHPLHAFLGAVPFVKMCVFHFPWLGFGEESAKKVDSDWNQPQVDVLAAFTRKPAGFRMTILHGPRFSALLQPLNLHKYTYFSTPLSPVTDAFFRGLMDPHWGRCPGVRFPMAVWQCQPMQILCIPTALLHFHNCELRGWCWCVYQGVWTAIEEWEKWCKHQDARQWLAPWMRQQNL